MVSQEDKGLLMILPKIFHNKIFWSKYSKIRLLEINTHTLEKAKRKGDNIAVIIAEHSVYV